MRVVLDLNTVDGYRTFLRVKSLPVYSFAGREAWFPDEYADRVGVTAPDTATADYRPHPGLFDYQAGIARLAVRKEKFAVFAEPGLGKTFIAGDFARHALDATPAGRGVLWVCPLMVVRQTVHELGRFYGGRLTPEVVRAADLPGWLSGGGRFGITNQEAISDGLPGDRLGCLILDDVSLKSHYGAWGARLTRMGRGVRRKLYSIGTPAPNDRIEYATAAVFLDRFPTVNSFLAKFFVNRGETANRWELKPHALRPFYRAMSDWCVFLSDPAVYGWKDNVAPLPPVRTHVLDVPLTAAQRDAAARITGGFACVPGGIGQRSKLARLAKDAAGHKPGFVADLVAHSPDPTIVWCRYNGEQAELARLLPAAGNITGTTPHDERVRVIDAYQRGDLSQVVTKGRILGFGLNLQVTRRMVFSTVQDSYEEFWQCVKRANRTGSKWPLDVYIPVTEIERPMLDTVLRKADRVAADTREQEQLFREVECVGA